MSEGDGPDAARLALDAPSGLTEATSALEAELRDAHQRADRLQQEVEGLRESHTALAELSDRRRLQIAELTTKLRESRARNDAIRRRLVVRAAVHAARVARQPTRLKAPIREASANALAMLGIATPGSRILRASSSDQARLARDLVAALPPAPSGLAMTIGAVIVSVQEDPDAVRRVSAALTAAGVDPAAIVVAATLAAREVAALPGDALLIVSDQIVPLEPAWLARLTHALLETGASAAGARIVHGRRPGPRVGPASAAADLTLRHAGVAFDLVDGTPVPSLVGWGGDPQAPELLERRDQVAVDSCVLVRRDALAGIGGIAPTQAVDVLDVDLCLRLGIAGGRVICAGDVVLWHLGSDDAPRAQAGVIERLRTTHMPLVARQVLLDRLGDGSMWSRTPVHVGLTVTRDDPAAGYGDWYTAHELGDELAALGWRVSYLERFENRWDTPPADLDAAIVLLDRYDIRNLPRHTLRIAWVRNWTDTWVKHAWFDDYDVVLASSEESRAIIERETSKVARLMPIATNPTRFRPLTPDPQMAADAVLTSNYWRDARAPTETLPALAAEGISVRLYGKGWEDVAEVAPYHQGHLPYDRLPLAYSSCTLVIDDNGSHTMPYGAVNSRVFDALAAGALVVTNNVVGARELFDDEFPTYDSPAQLTTVVRDLLADEDRRARLLQRYRDVVLSRHTYRARAAEVRGHLRDWAAAPRFAVVMGADTWEKAPTWGDSYFTRALQRQLERRGVPTVVAVTNDGAAHYVERADAVVHVFGIRAPGTRPGQVNILWIISHPDRVTRRMCDGYDVVFSASDRFAVELSRRIKRAVLPLHQATDPDRFFPDATGPHHEVLFVGNSRNVRRQVLDDLRATSHDLAVYGRGWTPDLLEPRFVRGEWIPNDELRRYYSSASIVLSDHWPDMRDEGFIANRVYDAVAAGALVISDLVPGIEDEFDRGVVTYRAASELREEVDHYLIAGDERRQLAASARQAVLARHTFGHRADVILREATPLLADRGWNAAKPLTDRAT